MEAILLLVVVFLIFGHWRLRRRVALLEEQWRSRTVPPAPVPEPVPAPAPAASRADQPTGDKAPPPAIERPASAARVPDVARTAPPEPAASAAPKAFVFRADLASRATGWLAENWFLAVAAVSLALAGVFLVQYGVERGLLTPFWRVMGAAGLGVALIAFGEVLRRRWGDAEAGQIAFLPSTFAGAGLVALFAAVLAARQLYGLIGPGTAFALLVAVSLVAVALGWFYGGFLTVVGLLGALAAPFLVGGSSDTPQMFFYYFAAVAVAGLLIDAVRRWAWVSVMVLILAFTAAWISFVGGAGDVHYLAFGGILTLAAVAIPPLSLTPRHAGPMVLSVLWNRTAGWPGFPTRIASGTFAAGIAVTLLVAWKDAGPVEVWAALAAIGALGLLATLWFRDAPALGDTALLPPLALLAVLVHQGLEFGALYPAISASAERLPESPPPMDITVLAGATLAYSALAFWRSQRAADAARLVWASGAALFAPLVLVVLELLFAPSEGLGAGRWAVHAIAVGAAMTLFAERSARSDGTDRRRAAIFALAAMTMIAFALILILSDAALTLALAVMVLLAAAIDRRFDMRYLAVFVQAGAIVVGWRLVFYPGIDWAIDAPLAEVLAAYGGSVGLFAAAWLVLAPMRRPATIMVLESAAWMLAGVGLSVLLYRWLGSDLETHWGMALMGLIWLISMSNQLYRLRVDGPLVRVRAGLAAWFALVAAFFFALAGTVFNPLLNWSEKVLGPPVLDTLFVAYGLPALVLAGVVWRLRHLRGWLRKTLGAVGAAFSVAYAGLEIRRFWRGDVLAVPGTTDGELYSYTVAMLAASVGLLLVAFARRSRPLRRIAVLGVGLTIAKVFLIDMSGLAGLVRVASFLGLGLSLAALAWISRKMTEEWDRNQEAADGPAD